MLCHFSLTLCDPVDGSLPGYTVHGILLARILDWVAISSSRGSSQPRNQPAPFTSPVLEGRFYTASATWETPLEIIYG